MPPNPSDNPKRNLILAALSSKEYARLVDDLELVALVRGQVLYEPGDLPDYVYFPTEAIVSRTFTTENGGSVELAMTGDDGLVGISLILGGETILYRVDVQHPGGAYRLKAEIMRWELDQGGELQRLSLRYTQSLMILMAQSIVCTRHHSVDQQVCRWLLLSLDRVSGNQLAITQERIAHMLGVRREGVTEVARKLQAAGLIDYSRGHLSLVDRPGLEARVCECYAAVKREQQRLYQTAPAIRIKSRARPNPATLRRRAESRLRQAAPALQDSAMDSTRLLHELQLRQIELEMQQEELRAAYGEADALRERYADIYDFAPAGYFTLDAQGTILDLNLAGAILLGIKRSQRNRYCFTSSVSPGDLAAFGQFIADVLDKTGRKRCEIALLPNAQRGEATVRIEAVADESGRECRMVVIDVSAEKQTARALAEREQYQRALLDNFPFMVWLKDQQGRYLAANAPLVKELGYSSAEALVGRTDFDVFPAHRAESYSSDSSDDLAAQNSGELRHDEELIEKNGQKRWFEIYKSAVVVNEQRVGTVGFARDVSQRHIMQQALVDSERQQRSFIENLPLSVAIVQDEVIRYINPKAIELSGYAPPECVGHPYLSLVFAADRLKARANYERRLHGDALARDFELRIVSKAGRIIDCHCHISRVSWDKRMASLAVLEDISEQKRIKSELQSLESTDLLTRLANRRHFMARLDEQLSRLQRGASQQVALLLIDLEPLIPFDNAADYAANEAMLRIFSTLLNDELRKADVGGRIGELNFAVLLAETELPTAYVFAERLRQKAIKASASIDPRIVLRFSSGITALAAADDRADKVVERARQALEQAKAAGDQRGDGAAGDDWAVPGISSGALRARPSAR